ncbi:hypothetical protein V6N13_137884 [Hibiscus sabdariffa]
MITPRTTVYPLCTMAKKVQTDPTSCVVFPPKNNVGLYQDGLVRYESFRGWRGGGGRKLEREAAERLWRLWVSRFVLGFCPVSVILGDFRFKALYKVQYSAFSMGSTSKMRDGEDWVGLGNVSGADMINFIDAINKELEGKEAIGTMDTEIPATNAYAEATIIRSQEQFMFDCFQGEGKMTRTILSFPFWFCTIRVKYVAPPLGNRFILEEDLLQNLGPTGFFGFLGDYDRLLERAT